MKVNGEAFKLARLKIRKNSPKRGAKGKPARGTQEWLAEKSGSSVRAIQYLEDGEASIATVDSVSSLLQLKGRELIIGYGKEHVTCRAQGLIDFRPAMYPKDDVHNFANTPVMVTLDPLTITCENIDIDFFRLEKVKTTISFSKYSYDFDWLYEVSLTPNGNGWLGIVKEAYPFDIFVEDQKKTLNIPIMHTNNSGEPLLWGDFVRQIEETSSYQANIKITLEFLGFPKEIKVFFSIDLLKIIFNRGRKKRSSDIPYRASIRLIG